MYKHVWVVTNEAQDNTEIQVYSTYKKARAFVSDQRRWYRKELGITLIEVDDTWTSPYNSDYIYLGITKEKVY